MKVSVFVKPGCKRPEPAVEPYPAGGWLVRVRERAHDGRANHAVVTAIAAHYGVPSGQVSIVSGHAARRKVLEVAGLDNP